MADKKLTMSQLAALAKAAARKVDPMVDKDLQKLGQVCVGKMKNNIHRYHAVDTGTMLNSVSAESQGTDTILIGPTVDYAVFVANGTSKMQARPFHLATIRDITPAIKKIGFNVQDLGL